jgi:hypothetical protein
LLYFLYAHRIICSSYESLGIMAMTDKDQSETPVSRAIKRRKELQDGIKASMKELEKLDEFLRMWRHLSADADEAIKGVETSEPHLMLGRAGHGQTQAMFEQYVRALLRDVGRPMQSGEIVEAFRERGHRIGGNETRTAWNRLWQAKDRGVLQNVPRYGYWFADEPVPEAVLAAPPPKVRHSTTGMPLRKEWAGRPQGRKRILTESQIKTLEEWFSEGKKTREEMARDLGGISLGTVNNYRLAWLNKRPEDDLPKAKRPAVSPKKKKK